MAQDYSRLKHARDLSEEGICFAINGERFESDSWLFFKAKKQDSLQVEVAFGQT